MNNREAFCGRLVKVTDVLRTLVRMSTGLFDIFIMLSHMKYKRVTRKWFDMRASLFEECIA